MHWMPFLLLPTHPPFLPSSPPPCSSSPSGFRPHCPCRTLLSAGHLCALLPFANTATWWVLLGLTFELSPVPLGQDRTRLPESSLEICLKLPAASLVIFRGGRRPTPSVSALSATQVLSCPGHQTLLTLVPAAQVFGHRQESSGGRECCPDHGPPEALRRCPSAAASKAKADSARSYFREARGR